MFLARVLFFKLHESAKFLVASKRASAAVVSLQRISKFNGTNSTWGLDDVEDDVSSTRTRASRTTSSSDRGGDASPIGAGESTRSPSPTRSPSISSVALSRAPLLDASDLESSTFSSFAPSDFERAYRRPEWVNRLPQSSRGAVTDYLSRVDELLEGKWRRTTLYIWAIWTLASAGYTVSETSSPESLQPARGTEHG